MLSAASVGEDGTGLILGSTKCRNIHCTSLGVSLNLDWNSKGVRTPGSAREVWRNNIGLSKNEALNSIIHWVYNGLAKPICSCLVQNCL